jgi:hypothetical protein
VSPTGFNFQDFNSNVVLRWEYRPGSALFVVWQQGRQSAANTEGNGNVGDDFQNLFNMHPNNTFLIKLSYWFDR